MSLILIPGQSGCGKSHMLFERVLREAQENPKRRFIVLVPDQNTLQTQKTLVSMSERGGIWNIDVLGFTRFAFRVFEQTGVERRRILSETGKVLLLRLIAEREGARIPILSGALDRPGVLNEMKSILSEMDQYGIGPEELGDIERLTLEDNAHPALARKIAEIALLKEAYERYQEGHFITGEKLLSVLCEKIPLDETLRGTIFCLDGFTGLTPAQLKVVTTLLPYAEDILVTVTIDPDQVPVTPSGRPDKSSSGGGGPQGLFALSKKTIRSLLRCADEAGCPVRVMPVLPGAGGRHEDGSELWWLERHLLRMGREGRVPYPGGEKRPQIFLRQCADAWDEAVSAAVTISELVRQGMRYREIAIVCGSLKDYAEYVRRAMDVYDIPCYIDRSSTVVMNPAFEFARCAISVLEKNFSYESVMALLRTGLAVDPEEGGVDLLENYVLAAGIRGHRMWSNPFERLPGDGNASLMEKAEKVRAAFMEKFEPFAQIMKKSKALFSGYAAAIWNLLLAFDVPAKLRELSVRNMEEGREDRAQEYAAVLRVICDVLDEAALVMGQEQVTRAQFSEILRAGFTEAKIGILPRGIDQVQVGDLERSRLEKIRVVLFLGLNDEYVPGRKNAGGVLTDLEREYLGSRDVHLAPTVKEQANIQQFYLYLAMTRPSHSLYLSWSTAKRGGQEMRPSGMIARIRALFPQAAWAGAASANPFESVTSLENGTGILSQMLGDYLYTDRIGDEENADRLRELINLYRRQKEEWARNAESFLRSLTRQEKCGELDEKTAAALYGTILKGSISRLEEFSACAFRHFADYGLGLKEREEFSIRPIDMGNLLHTSIEILSRKLKDPSSPGWRGISEDERELLAREALSEALVRVHGSELYKDNSRFAETFGRCESMFLRSVKTIQRQIMAGSFEPSFFELSFGKEDPRSVWIEHLPGGKQLQLSGKIDRIDLCDEEGSDCLFLKIVDYKSSSRDVDLDSLIEGEQLQLIVYMDAAAKMAKEKYPEREIVCAGAFYFPFQDPVTDLTEKMTPEEQEEAVVAAMRVKGLVNLRGDVIERLDNSPWEAGASKVIPIIKNRTPGEVRAADNVVTDRQFDLLRRYSEEQMKRIASDILSGRIAPNPSRKDSATTACSFCPYCDVCGFDPTRRGMAYREKEKRSRDRNWEIIEETVSGCSIPDEKPEEKPGEERKDDARLDEGTKTGN